MLNEQRFDAPVIHVVSESPRLEMLQARLRQAGLRPVPVRGSYLPPDAAPALLDLLTDRNELSGLENRLIVTIGKSARTPDISDIHLADVSQVDSLPARLAIRQREAQRQREIQLRVKTAERLGAASQAAAPVGKARLLWLGQDAPFLNAIKSSLGAGSVNLVAAISRLTAEDYLSSGSFQTLVLCPSSLDDEAAKLLRKIKTLALPVLPRVVLLLRPDLVGQLPSEDMAQADQIIDLTSDVEQLVRSLNTISNGALAEQQIRPMAHTGVEDSITGLVSREYIESHVAAQMRQSDHLASPLSVVAFSIGAPENLKQVAQTIQAHLRDTDLAGRLDGHHICITLPDTNYRGAVVLARRIEQALEWPISWRAIERRQFHTVQTLLGGLTAKSLLKRQRPA